MSEICDVCGRDSGRVAHAGDPLFVTSEAAECYRLGYERVTAELAAAEERGRRLGVEERDELRALLTRILDLVIRWHNLSNTTTKDYRDDGLTGILDDLQAKLDEALAAIAPRDSAPSADPGKVCDCGESPSCTFGASRDCGKEG